MVPLLGGLALLIGGGLMMSGGSKPEEKSEAKPAATKEEASPVSAKTAAAPAESSPVVSHDAGNDTIDVEIQGASSLEDGTMMEVKVGEGKQDKVLVTRFGGKLYAIGAFCSHFGAPLINGVLFDDKVLCPWHAAGFSVTSGALEYAPGRDGVPKYEVHEKDGKWFVRVPKKLEQKQIAHMAKRDPSNKTKMVIVGGGPAGLNCAETLRQSNFTGEISVISAEKVLPYDRTLLSKVLATGDASKLSLRDSNFYDSADIDYHLGYKVGSIDRDSKQVSLENGDKINYDKLLLATGGRARAVRNPGSQSKGIYLLRTGED